MRVKVYSRVQNLIVNEKGTKNESINHYVMLKMVIPSSKCRYDLGQADLAVASFNDLSVINLRRLFAHKGSTFMELEKQVIEKTPPRRKLTIDTIF